MQAKKTVIILITAIICIAIGFFVGKGVADKDKYGQDTINGTSADISPEATPELTSEPDSIKTSIKDDFYEFSDEEISKAAETALKDIQKAFPEYEITEMAYPGNYDYLMQRIWEQYSSANITYEKGEVIYIALHVFFSDSAATPKESAVAVVLARDSVDNTDWKHISISPLESWWAITNTAPIEFVSDSETWNFFTPLYDYSSMNEQESKYYYKFSDEEISAALNYSIQRTVENHLNSIKANLEKDENYYKRDGHVHCDLLEVYFNDNAQLETMARAGSTSKLSAEDTGKKIEVVYKMYFWYEDGVEEGAAEPGYAAEWVSYVRESLDSLEWTVEQGMSGMTTWSTKTHTAPVDKFVERGYMWNW